MEEVLLNCRGVVWREKRKMKTLTPALSPGEREEEKTSFVCWADTFLTPHKQEAWGRRVGAGCFFNGVFDAYFIWDV